MTSNKVTDLIKSSGFSYSFELTPDVDYSTINDLEVQPVFFSITWHAKTHKCEDFNIAPIKLAKHLRRLGKQVMLHLSCDMLKKDYLNQLLDILQENDICNLFVVFGEKYDAATSDFKSSQELIAYIRERKGSFFCIGVAGSPDHTDEKISQLKDKINSGADFILTQAFFEASIFKNYEQRCQELGINVPIIPGAFLFEKFKQLDGFIKLCKVKVSNSLLEQVSKEEIENPGTEIMKQLLKDVMVETKCTHFHFFTLNKLESVCKFIKEL